MKKFLFNYGTNILVIIISLLTFIIGIFTIGFLKAFFIVAALDLLWFLPPLLKKKKKKIPKKKGIYEMKKKKETYETKQKKEKKRKKKRKIWKIILLIFLLLFILACIAAGIFLVSVIKDAPKFNPDNLYTKESSIVYTKNGEVMAKLGAENREIITYDQMSESLINAIIATEDSRFFQHNGFDLPRFLVASVKQVLGRPNAGGASTLTMQVSKNFFTSTESEGFEGIKRKFTDIYMSIFQIEKNYSKEEILEFYANSNYLGGGAYGVEQASLNYFGKHASELNVAEAALIAGLFQAPYTYDPYRNPEKAETRRKTVLYLMERHGYISEEEKKAAEKLTVEHLLKPSAGTDNTKYLAFLDTVVAEVIEDTKTEENPDGDNPYEVPMEIYTTMDPAKQDYINDVMDGKTFNWENDKVQAGIIALDNESGAIVAVGAGRNRTGLNSFNAATQTKKQIGSTAKPLYDYGPGIEYENWSTYQPFIDEPYTYSDGTSIGNWDGGYKGFQTLRQALVDSRNIPALKAFQQNKNSNIKKFVTSLGLSPENPLHEAHAIGGYTGESPLTISAAYAAFARGGYYVEPYSYTKIVYRDTNKTVEKPIKKTKVMSDATAYMITDVLIDTAPHTLGSNRYINGVTYAAKTGTSNFDTATKEANSLPSSAINDLWVVGYDPQYSIAVWYGYKSLKDGYTIYGSRQHARLFQKVASGFFTSGKTWTKPDSVSEVQIEYGSNPPALASENTPQDKIVTELFKVGTEPTKVSTNYLKLSDPTGLKATVNNNKVTLTWNKVEPPSYLDTSSYGTLGYNVYRKENNELKLLKFVTGTTYTDTVSANTESVTYVVKAAFEKEANFTSTGATLNVTIKEKETEISITFEDGTTVMDKQETVSLTNLSTLTVPNIVVKEDGKTIFTGNKSNSTVTITPSIPDTSTCFQTEATCPIIITYKVTYNGTTKSLGRRVTVTET